MDPSQRRNNCLIGCAAAGLLAVLVLFGLAKLIQRGSDWIRGEIQEYQAWQDLETAWVPPGSEAPLEAWFHTNVANHSLAAIDTNATVAFLGLTGPGYHAVYTNQSGSMHLYVYPAETEQARKGIYALAKQAVEDFEGPPGRGVTRHQVNIDRIYSFGVSPPRRRGFLWWQNGWVWLAWTRDDLKPDDFLLKYLQSFPAESGGEE